MSTLGVALLATGLAPVAGAVDAARPLADLGRTVWQEELPQLSVHAIAQTGDRYLWIATQQGLARFDGTRFTVFNSRNAEALRRNVIWGLLGSRVATATPVSDGAPAELVEAADRALYRAKRRGRNQVASFDGE